MKHFNLLEKLQKIEAYRKLKLESIVVLLIASPSTIDKMFKIYTFFENRTEICILFRNRTEIYTSFKNRTESYTFFKNRFKIYTCILFKNRTEISNILSMVDGLSIRPQKIALLKGDAGAKV